MNTTTVAPSLRYSKLSVSRSTVQFSARYLSLTWVYFGSISAIFWFALIDASFLSSVIVSPDACNSNAAFERVQMTLNANDADKKFVKDRYLSTKREQEQIKSLEALEKRIYDSDGKRLNRRISGKAFTAELSLLAKVLSEDSDNLSKSVDVASDILMRLERFYLNHGNQTCGDDNVLELDSIAYNAVANTWVKSKRADAGEKVLRLVNHMEDLERKSRSYDGAIVAIRPSSVTFNIAIKAWTTCGEERAVVEAEKLLERMSKRYIDGHRDCKPDTFTYSALIDVYASLKNLNGSAERVEEILNGMEDLYMAGDKTVKPNIFVFTSVIDAWNQSNHPKAPYYAQKILFRALDFYETGDEDFQPNPVIFSATISGWARRASLEPRSLENIGTLYRLMEKYSVVPNVFTYTSIISAYAKGGDVSKAEFFVDEMRKKGVKPNFYTYSSLISAYAKSNVKDSVTKAESILDEMERLYEAGDNSMQPNVVSFSSVLDAYYRSNDRDVVSKMEKLVKRMESLYDEGSARVKPTTDVYNQLLSALVRKGYPDCGEKATEWIKHMVQRDVKPDARTYKSVILAHMKSGGKVGAKRGEDVLQRMEGLNSKAFIPDVMCYNAVIRAYARIGDGEKAFQILRRMLESSRTQPNKITFNTVLDAFAKSGHKGAGEKAESLLNEMYSLYEDGAKQLEPDVVSYSSVINAYAKSNSDPRSAERILNQMTTNCVSPDIVCFNSLIQAWSYSTEPNKARKAKNILDRVERNEHVYTSIGLYNSVLQACALSTGSNISPNERSEALSIARSLFAELEKSKTLRPNSLIYGTMLKCCTLASKETREKLIIDVFVKCRNAGHVDARVAYLLCMATQNSRRILGDLLIPGVTRKDAKNRTYILTEKLPPGWSRNVKKRNVRKRSR